MSLLTSRPIVTVDLSMLKTRPFSGPVANLIEPDCGDVSPVFNGMRQGVPGIHARGGIAACGSTPSLPLLSFLDRFIHVCYHVLVGLGTSGSPEERRFAYGFFSN